MIVSVCLHMIVHMIVSKQSYESYEDTHMIVSVCPHMIVSVCLHMIEDLI